MVWLTQIADLRASTDQEITGVILEYHKLKAHIERYMEEIQLDDGARQRTLVYQDFGWDVMYSIAS